MSAIDAEHPDALTADELAVLEADAAAGNAESAALLRRYRVARPAIALVRVLGHLVDGRVRREDVPVLAANLRWLADELDAERPTLN